MGVKFQEEAKKAATEKASVIEDAKEPSPATSPASADIKTDAPAEKELANYEKYASNDGDFVRSKLDDGTNVAAGNIMENQARHPAHQQHEIAVEDDAPGFEQSNALMLPRGSAHYAQGGSAAEVHDGEALNER